MFNFDEIEKVRENVINKNLFKYDEACFEEMKFAQQKKGIQLVHIPKFVE